MSIEKLQAENARLKTEVEHLMVFCNSTLIPSKELQAENARLKAEVEHWQEQWHFVIQDNNKQMDEIAALKAEVERLRKLFADTERLMLLEGEYEAAKVGTYANLKAEVERLRAASFVTAVPVEQYERLIKAGDAMAEELIGRYFGNRLVTDWNAAKEGKQP